MGVGGVVERRTAIRTVYVSEVLVFQLMASGFMRLMFKKQQNKKGSLQHKCIQLLLQKLELVGTQIPGQIVFLNFLKEIEGLKINQLRHNITNSQMRMLMMLKCTHNVSIYFYIFK